MIRFKLGEILAARNLKRTILSKETGISRNTLSSITTNSTEMVRLDTIGKICKHLGITPNDFFEYVPIDFDISIEEIVVDLDTDHAPIKIERIEVNFVCLIEYLPKESSQKLVFELNGKGNNIYARNFSFYVNFNEKSEEEEFCKIKDSLSPGLKSKLVQDLKNQILDAISKSAHKRIKNDLAASILHKNLDLILEPDDVTFFSDSALFEIS